MKVVGGICEAAGAEGRATARSGSTSDHEKSAPSPLERPCYSARSTVLLHRGSERLTAFARSRRNVAVDQTRLIGGSSRVPPSGHREKMAVPPPVRFEECTSWSMREVTNLETSKLADWKVESESEGGGGGGGGWAEAEVAEGGGFREEGPGFGDDIRAERVSGEREGRATKWGGERRLYHHESSRTEVRIDHQPLVNLFPFSLSTLSNLKRRYPRRFLRCFLHSPLFPLNDCYASQIDY